MVRTPDRATLWALGAVLVALLLVLASWTALVHRFVAFVVGGVALSLVTALGALALIALGNRRRTLAGLRALEAKTAELERAHEALARTERLAVLGQIAGGVAHELRNPLGVIRNSVYYLRMVVPSDDDRVRKHLAMVDREVTAANRIVSDLLDFARVRSPEVTPTDLAAVAREVLERTPPPAGVEVVVREAPDAPCAAVDPAQIHQVLGNLVTNAVQAMPDGGTLTIAVARDGGRAAISVTDTGAGVAPEHLPRLFQPLFTTNPRGIGLGLAVARRLAEANGGTIEVWSEPGRGSRFSVRLPAAGAGGVAAPGPDAA